MGLMYLTTLERVRAALNRTGTADDAEIESDIVAASAMMQAYMSRGIHVEQRTETRWATASGVTFLQSWPVRSIASVNYRSASGSLIAVPSSGYWFCDGNELHLPRLAPRTPVEVTYTGGLAYSVDAPVYAVASSTGTPAPGAFTSQRGASGTLTVYGSGTATLKVTGGSFSSGDILTGTGWTITLGDTVQESIFTDAPDLAKACEMQAAYMFQRRNSLGRTAVQSGNAQTTFQGDYDLLAGVKRILDLYDPQLVI